MRFSGKQKVSHSLDELSEKKKTKLSKGFKSIDAVLFNWLENKVIEKKKFCWSWFLFGIRMSSKHFPIMWKSHEKLLHGEKENSRKISEICELAKKSQLQSEKMDASALVCEKVALDRLYIMYVKLNPRTTCLLCPYRIHVDENHIVPDCISEVNVDATQ